MANKWVIFTEDGVYAPLGDVWHKTKLEAIELCSDMTLDPRNVPKVSKVHKGYYIYEPKDVDNPSSFSGESFMIKHKDVLDSDDLQTISDFEDGEE